MRADYDLVVKKNCLACHQIDKRKYGPNFKEVAAKYADQKNAADVLAKKIRRGGTGVWGQDIMPPQPQVSAAEVAGVGQVHPVGEVIRSERLATPSGRR